MEPGRNGVVHDSVKCHRCNKFLHYVDQCNQLSQDEQGKDDTNNENQQQNLNASQVGVQGKQVNSN